MRIRKPLTRIAVAGGTLLALYAGLLCAPQPLFPFVVRADTLVLHSDRPLSETAGRHVLDLAEKKLARSPLYSVRTRHHVFVCNSRWRQVLFFNKDYAAGGVSLYPVTINVFLRAPLVEDNRLISPRGTPVPGDRTLDYFVAHEVTHALTGESIGPVRFYRLPQWVREGYADYVGKGSAFDYAEARHAFLAGAREMDFSRSGLYWRFHLLVAHLLDHEGWTVERLLNDPPPQSEVETRVREEIERR